MLDVVHVINYLFKSGQALCDICTYLGLRTNVAWQIGPIEGLTTAWHNVPDKTLIPQGCKTQFRVLVPADAKVNWTGAVEVSRTSEQSMAQCKFDNLGTYVVKAECILQSGEKLTKSSTFEVVNVPTSDIKLEPIVLLAIPLNLDENSSNEATMKYFDGPSIAAFRQVGENRYRTSVKKPVTGRVKVEPAGFAPLMEWRIDGVAKTLGETAELRFGIKKQKLPDLQPQEAEEGDEWTVDVPGVFPVSVGPINEQKEVQIELYKVSIGVSQARYTLGPCGPDKLPEGSPITFEAVTDPPGYENEITWLSSTLYGTAQPVLGYGPTFAVQYDGTFGGTIGHQWIGVKADNATLEQDQGCGDFFVKVDYATGSTPWSVYASDLDGDGDRDLAVANWASNSVSILKNNGDGTFAAKVDYPTSNGPFSVYASDLDGDGDQDLATANDTSDNVSILKNNGNGTFAAKVDYPTGNGPVSVYASDLDGDGDLDLATANFHGDNVSILKNNGNGTFAAKVDYGTGDAPREVYASDLDGDGDRDLAIPNEGSDNVSILKNNGNGTFAAKVDYPTGDAPRSVYASDLDGDGDLDLAIPNAFSANVSVLKNNGNGTFAAKVDYGTGSSPRDVYASDLDEDGDPDLAVANENSNTVSILKNNGNGTFATKVDYGTGVSPGSVCASNLDGDVDLDLAVANATDNTVSVLIHKGY
ncbi:MAG: hypothetical protein A2145_05460 [candidate division Zixibacteria bacterium RBG_16_40_9]|nr:MAG: hypothetical protein A2145_05460 [candidate division Zixibacteria bacterium RBG_16_40_9]